MDLVLFFRDYFPQLGPNEFIHTRSFHRDTGESESRWFATAQEAAAYALALDSQHWDAYFGTASRRQGGGKKADVVRLYSLWADVDYKHFKSDDEALVVLNGFELPPSYLVASGGGIQAYWLLAQPLDAAPATVAHAEALMLRLYQRLGGLDKVQDVSRIMRVPGTRNQKYPEKPLVTLELAAPERRYTLDQFEQVLPPLPEYEALPGVENSYLPPKEAEIRDMLAVLPTHGWDYRDYLGILMAVHSVYPDARGVRLIQGWSPALDSNGEDITAAKFQSFRNKGISVGTLVKLAQEHGWQPKRGPKIRLIRDGTPRKEATDEGLQPWRDLLQGYPELDRDEVPYHLRAALDYIDPLQKPFASDWKEAMFLTFFSSQFQRVRFENLNLSLWFLGMAGQGVGKSVGMDEWSTIFNDITNMRELDMPRFTGGTARGLGNRLAGDNKAVLAIFDEYSAYAKSMASEHGNSLKELMNQFYDGRGFAHNKADEVIVGTDPYLVSVGVTTPQAFRGSVKMDDMLDGYMSRMFMCAVDTDDFLPERRDKLERAALTDSLLAHIQSLAHVTEARFDTLAGEAPPVLRRYMAQYGMNSGKRRDLDKELGQEVTLPWGRVIARVKKVATLLALLEETPNVVGETVYVHERHVALAIRLCHRGAAYHQRALGWLSFTKDEENDQKVVAMLEKLGYASSRKLQQRCHLNKREVDTVLESLHFDGRVGKQENRGGTEFYLIRR